MLLSRFKLMFYFYAPQKSQKTRSIFLYPLKTPENQKYISKVLWRFRELQKWNIGLKWVNKWTNRLKSDNIWNKLFLLKYSFKTKCLKFNYVRKLFLPYRIP